MLKIQHLLILLLFALPSTVKALDTIPVLSLDIAKHMASGCEKKAKAEGWKMSIAVVDSGANLMFFQRMPNTFIGSIDMAINKAKTSAKFPFPTRFFATLGYGQQNQNGWTVP